LLRAPGFGVVSFRFWHWGLDWPLRAEAMIRRRSILQGAWDAALAEWREIAPFLPSGSARLCDIGCGHALMDLVAARHRSPLKISLVDIEQTSARNHGFASAGAGYASLANARRFLTTNGVPDESVETCNPRRDSLPAGPFDLIISLLSAGHHYPVSEYVDFALNTLRPGGAFIFDMRHGKGQEDSLRPFSEIRTLRRTGKSSRVAAIR
jgi:SAM-dependent methyltransferase